MMRFFKFRRNKGFEYKSKWWYDFYIIERSEYEFLKQFGEVVLSDDSAIVMHYAWIEREEKMNEDEIQRIKSKIQEWMARHGWREDEYIILCDEVEV